MPKAVICIATTEEQAAHFADQLKEAGLSGNDVAVLMDDRARARDFAHALHSAKAPGSCCDRGDCQRSCSRPIGADWNQNRRGSTCGSGYGRSGVARTTGVVRVMKRNSSRLLRNSEDKEMNYQGRAFESGDTLISIHTEEHHGPNAAAPYCEWCRSARRRKSLMARTPARPRHWPDLGAQDETFITCMATRVTDLVHGCLQSAFIGYRQPNAHQVLHSVDTKQICGFSSRKAIAPAARLCASESVRGVSRFRAVEASAGAQAGSRASRRMSCSSISKDKRKRCEKVCTSCTRSGFDIPAIVMAEEADFDTAVSTIKSGAYDFLSKPINSSHLRVVLSNLASQLSVAEENQRLRRKLIEAGTLGSIIGHSFAMRRVMRLVEEAAASSAPVLIVGESGTGKKLVARTIHQLSARRSGPFAEVSLRRVARQPHGERTVGPRARRFRGSRSPPRRISRDGRWRHAVARRNYRAEGRPSGQAAANDRGKEDAPHGRQHRNRNYRWTFA